jgi:hypothetical protein
MPYVIEKKSDARKQRQVANKLQRREKKAARKKSIPFEVAHKARWDDASGRSNNKLADRADDKARSERDAKDKTARMHLLGVDHEGKPTSTMDRMKLSRGNASKGRPAKLRTTTPNAREKETKLYKDKGASSIEDGFVRSSALVSLNEETSELEKRCIADVMAKSSKGSENTLSRAYAICRASLQKSGRIKKGKATLTKKGGKISGGKAKKDDHSDKVSRFEKHVVAARKK